MIPIAKPMVGEEEKKAVMAVLDSGMLVQGPKVKALEEKFAAFCGVKHAIAVSNGTAALHCALKSIGIVQGDEVITTPFTFVASANAILMCGAVPVFADIDEKTFNVSPAEVEKKITKKTKAILAVDLYGLPADYNQLNAIAKKHGIRVIADACQSVGAELDGKKTGSLAHVSAFSLYATKNIMCGEGGMITTNDDKVDEFARKFRHHGQKEQYSYEFLGYNYRLTDMAAAIALCQLEKVNKVTEQRNKNASMLTKLLQDAGVTLPKVPANTTHAFHQFTIKTHDRDALHAHLHQAGIDSRIFYPQPLHCAPQFAGKEFPRAEEASLTVLSLPIHPFVTEKDLRFIAETIITWQESRPHKKIYRDLDALRAIIEKKEPVLKQLRILKKDAQELERCVDSPESLDPAQLPSTVIDDVIKTNSTNTEELLDRKSTRL